jgi:hypothetical protein
MSSSADISTLYREFTQALTDVLAEHAVGPASRLLNRDHDPFLPTWELDRTSRLAREAHIIDLARQRAIEALVSQYIQGHFTFIVFRVDDKPQRLGLESKMISTVSLCEECQPSAKWLGLYSPKDKIRTSGLWLVNELYKEPLSIEDLELLKARMVDGPYQRKRSRRLSSPRSNSR